MAHVNETSTPSTSPSAHRIRELLAQERLLEARELLKEALRDEGDNPELRRFQVVLAPPEVTPVAFNDVDRSDELRWIASHGKEYRRRPWSRNRRPPAGAVCGRQWKRY